MIPHGRSAAFSLVSPPVCTSRVFTVVRKLFLISLFIGLD